ncbi:MAG: A24 family peptidase C-terminal domain-containing protein [Methanomassiliicoccales archaeon]
MDIYYLLAVSAALSIFFLASAQDLISREVSDILWIVGGLIAFILIIAGLMQGKYGSIVSEIWPVALLAFLYADIFIPWKNEGRSVVRYALGVLLGLTAAYELAVHGLQEYSLLFYSMVLWFFFIVLLYKIDIIKGGADAKALLLLLLLFPVYPAPLIAAQPPFFENFTFPLFLSVLLMAAIFSMAVPLWNLLHNAIKHEWMFPEMLLGRRIEVWKVNLEKHWLLESIDADGSRVRMRHPGKEDDRKQLDAIVSARWKRVWVSQKVPFVVPITAGLLFVLLLGSPLLLL